MENTNYPLQEKLHALVNNALSDAERQSLLKAATTDAEMADELAFSQQLATVLRHREMLEANAVLSNVLATEGFPPPVAPPPTGGWTGWKIGLLAVFALSILAVGGYLWLGSPSSAPVSAWQQTASDHLQPLENVLFLPSTGNDLAQLQAGMQVYDSKQYAAAARLLALYTERQPDLAAKVYLGVALLMEGRHKAAIQPLADAQQSPEPPVQAAAQWYLALAHLGNNNAAAARELLEGLASGGLFEAQAKSLLNQLPAQQ